MFCRWAAPTVLIFHARVESSAAQPTRQVTRAVFFFLAGLESSSGSVNGGRSNVWPSPVNAVDRLPPSSLELISEHHPSQSLSRIGCEVLHLMRIASQVIEFFAGPLSEGVVIEPFRLRIIAMLQLCFCLGLGPYRHRRHGC